MKTHHGLFGRICGFSNLLASADAAEKGRRLLPACGAFRVRLEAHLLRIQEQLQAGTWMPGPYQTRLIHWPKQRIISAAPFADRVVHHALCRVVMPFFEQKMIYDLWSNRKGKGTHGAVARAQSMCRKFRYVLKCDVQKFFPSIDHLVLKQQIRRTVACPETLSLMDKMIDGSNPQEVVCQVFPGDDLVEAATRRVGLPIGNLTSQWFGGIILTDFDHWVQEELGAGYLRYVDDFLVFGNDKQELANWRIRIRERLGHYRLRLHPKKCQIFPTSHGVPYLGHQIWPTRVRLAREKVARTRRRFRHLAKACRNGVLTPEALQLSWAGWQGHAAGAKAWPLMSQMAAIVREGLCPAGKPVPACCGVVRGTIPRTTCGALSATTTHPQTRTTTTGFGVSGGMGDGAHSSGPKPEPGGTSFLRGVRAHGPPAVASSVGAVLPLPGDEYQGGGGAGNPQGERPAAAAPIS